MGFFKKIAKSVIDTALVPVGVVQDIATMGDINKPHTKNRLKKILEDLEDAYDALDD